MKWLIAFLTVLASSVAFSQNPVDTLGNIYDDLGQKKEGTLYLKNGQKISAYIDYSTFNNVLRVTSDKRLPKPLTPQNVERFEYFDESLLRERVFVSRDFEFPEYKIEKSRGFFEILNVGDGFTLATRSYSVDLKSKFGSPTDPYKNTVNPAAQDYNYTQKAITITNQLEVVCFFVGDEIKPYLIYKTKEVDNLSGKGLRLSSSKQKSKIVDSPLPKSLMGNKFEATKKFASANQLRWSDKDELVLIVEHYNKIE